MADQPLFPASALGLPVIQKNVSREDLARHVGFLHRSAKNESNTLVVQPDTSPGLLIVSRELRKKTLGYFVLRCSVGYLGRDNVERIQEFLEDEGIEYRARFNPKRRNLRDVRIRYPLEEVLAPNAVAADIARFSEVLGSNPEGPYELTYGGFFSDSYYIQPNDPVQLGPSPFSRGFVVGGCLRVLTRRVAAVVGLILLILLIFKLLG